MRTLDDAPELNVFDPEYQADPVPVMKALLEETTVVSTPLGPMVIGRDQVHELLGDSRLRSSVLDLVVMQGVTDGPVHDLIAASIIVLDGPDHQRIRRLVSRSFTPKATEPHRPVMRAIAEELLAPIRDVGRCEFMSAFADKYPIQVMCHLLGIPREDHAQFAHWGDSLTHVLSLDLASHLAEVTEASAGMIGYLDELIESRRRAPSDDLVGQLVQAGEDGDRLSPLELRSLIGSLLFAGFDTTRNQLGLGVDIFCDHPDQWELVAAKPEIVTQAAEELLRYQGVVGVTARIALEDLEVDGWAIPKGSMVSLSLAAANHASGAYEDPWSFDITIPREPQFTFGAGPHFCLGANLARAELQEALPGLAQAMPELAHDGDPEWRPAMGIYGPTRLPIRWRAG